MSPLQTRLDSAEVTSSPKAPTVAPEMCGRWRVCDSKYVLLEHQFGDRFLRRSMTLALAIELKLGCCILPPEIPGSSSPMITATRAV